MTDAGRSPRVEFLWWAECPSWERALEDLRAAMGEAGLDPSAIEIREVSSEDDAEREGFVGSPTIRVEGVDIEPAEGPAALACRVYRRRDGRVSPLPDPESLRDALAGAPTR